MKFRVLVVLIASLVSINCSRANKEDENTAFSESESSLEGSLNTLGAAADDMGQTSAISSFSVGTSATGSFCERAAAQTCLASGSNGIKSISYNGCVIPYTHITANGQVALTFNTNSCSLANPGDAVARSYDVTFEGYYGSTLKISSESHQNYQGVTLGGGGEALKTASGWELSVHGQHRVAKTPRGREVGNISIRTTAPVIVTGTLSKENRTINSGSLEVAHNLAKYTAVYTPNNLHWDSSCCYPISGSLSVVLSGSDTRSANVEITGCGTAKVTFSDGSVENKTFRYCE